MKKTKETTGRVPENLYVPPKVEVMDVMVEQNVLDSGSSDGAAKEVPGFEPGAW